MKELTLVDQALTEVCSHYVYTSVMTVRTNKINVTLVAMWVSGLFGSAMVYQDTEI